MEDIDLRLVEESYARGQAVLRTRSAESRKRQGQFLTPPAIARYMASMLGSVSDGCHILEPSIGSGTLAMAAIEQAIAAGNIRELWVTGYELDSELLLAARASLQAAVDYARDCGISIHARIEEADFVAEHLRYLYPHQQPRLITDDLDAPNYDLIIANPPYFKLPAQQANGHTNIYTQFMALASKLMSKGGRACFIVPRSFCSGAYFDKFRKAFVGDVEIESIHLFEARDDNFTEDEVLQENIILRFSPRNALSGKALQPAPIRISSSRNSATWPHVAHLITLSAAQVLGQEERHSFIFLPTSELDVEIMSLLKTWPGSLRKFGLEVSTGPVVPFRSREWLLDSINSAGAQGAVPLLWMNHVTPQAIRWPLGISKPEAISAGSGNLLIRRQNYVLLRRFSTKEEVRRLIAAPCLDEQFDQWSALGIENHVNFIHRAGDSLSRHEAIGLSSILNCAILDRYIRTLNGHTQINAAELRDLPLPPLAVIEEIGKCLDHQGEPEPSLDTLIFDHLQAAGFWPETLPRFEETRFSMGKIQEAQGVLQDLGMAPGQHNEMAALILLVLASLQEGSEWSDARRSSLRIHDILIAMKQFYDREYAENSRETVRRQVLHQFEQAGLVLRNPDEPDLPTNSPRTHYALTDLAAETIRLAYSEQWPDAVSRFLAERVALIELYQLERERILIPVVLSDGRTFTLSPGEHNQLQAAIVNDFAPRFAPGATLLYLGDTAQKHLVYSHAALSDLGVPITMHDKLPDIVLHDQSRNWLFLIEAVTSHGPVSPKRLVELEAMLKNCGAGRVYVSAFPKLTTFKTHLSDIAWETEVWIAEIPDHMIHFNGDRFLGPRSNQRAE